MVLGSESVCLLNVVGSELLVVLQYTPGTVSRSTVPIIYGLECTNSSTKNRFLYSLSHPFNPECTYRLQHIEDPLNLNFLDKFTRVYLNWIITWTTNVPFIATLGNWITEPLRLNSVPQTIKTLHFLTTENLTLRLC